MNKITTTAGIVAITAVSLQAQVLAPTAGTPGAQKPWSVSATLRGFYDDNYNTAPDFLKRDSFGFEVSPSAGLNIIREQTAIGLSYVYSMRYYEDRSNNTADHMHQANGKISHAFSERFKADLSDSFVVAQEPTLLDPTAVVSVPLRTDGSNMRNTVQASFTAGLTENLDVVLGYSNNWYDYEQRGFGSRSALLDRMEHLGSINFRQVLLPKTVGVLGYQYGVTDYNSPDPIGRLGFFGPLVSADIRDNTSHYAYLGVDQGITPTLNASLRGGIQYTEYDNALPGMEDDNLSPYVDANATWNYMEGSYAQLGVRHTRTATDVGFTAFGATPTLDAEATTVYGSLNQRIAGRLVASLLSQYQHATFEGGYAGDMADDFFLVGLNLSYEINKFLAAEAGYNYDMLESDLDAVTARSYDRNRVYVGIRATY
ncbi:MAG: outer membrane beta-barrel protein [Verrucomicrobiales bacterium]